MLCFLAGICWVQLPFYEIQNTTNPFLPLHVLSLCEVCCVICSAHWSLCCISAFLTPALSLLWFYDSQRFNLFVFLKKIGPSCFAFEKEEPCKVTHDSLETGPHTVGIPFQTMSMGRNRLFPVKRVSLLCFEGSQDMGKIMQGSHRLEKSGIALFAACTKPKAYGKTLGNCLWCCKEDLNALKIEKVCWVLVGCGICSLWGRAVAWCAQTFRSPWLCSAGTAQHNILGAEAARG